MIILAMLEYSFEYQSTKSATVINFFLLQDHWGDVISALDNDAALKTESA